MSFVTRFTVVLSLTVASLVMTGCAGAQVVQKTPHGGIVELGNESDSARAKAEDLMRKECPFGYRIVDEQETKIAYACKDAAPATPSGASDKPAEVGVSI